MIILSDLFRNFALKLKIMDNTKDNFAKGNIVVFAGAGISKDSPANIPDWNKYNNLLINEIGRMGSDYLGEPENILGEEDYSHVLSLTSLSDFIFDYIAGDAYFPLLKILDGAQPNSHHLLLASLAKAKKIKAIVTTNFDTLIEKAFIIKEVPYAVYDEPNSFNIEDHSNLFPIYKIHGSVTNTKEAIDTVTQKIRGLSYEKEAVLKHLFENNHFVFIGFSGADFDFKDYYIPINYSKKGITWVTWDISNRIKLFEKNIPNFRINNIKEATLYSFYEEIGWKDYCSSNEAYNEPINYDDISRSIHEIFVSMPIPRCAYAGMCIKIFEAMAQYEKVDKYINILDAKFKNLFGGEDNFFDHIIIPEIEKSPIHPRQKLHLGKVTNDEAYSYIALLETIGDIFIRYKKSNVALEYYEFSYRIQKAREFMYINGWVQCNPSKLYNNLSATLGGIARLYLKSGYFNDAHIFSVKAELEALSARRMKNFSVMHYYNVITTYHDKKKEEEYIRELCVCVRFAQMSGTVDVLFDLYIEIAKFFYNRNLKIYTYALFEAHKYSGISFRNYQHRGKFDIKVDESLSKEFKTLIRSLGVYVEKNSKYQWTGVVERDVLKYKEGRLAKKKYEEGKFEESISILRNASVEYKKSKQVEELFCFTIVRVMLLSGLSFSNDQYITLLEKCIRLQIENLQTDFLVLTLHYYSNILIQEGKYSDALFFAKIALGICVSPEEHSVILGTCLVAVECCFKMDLKADAKAFLTKYIEYSNEYPFFVEHSCDDYVEKMKCLLQKD